MKKMRVLLLVLTVFLCGVLLCACSGEADYEVKVLDAQGNPYTSGVIVKFLQNGAQVAMQPVDGNGVAKKALTKGDYTVELVFTDESISGYFDPAAAVLSKKEMSIELTLYNSVSGEGVDLFATSPVTGESKDYKAYHVAAGGTYVPVAAKERNYFIFVPTQAGTYKISVDNSALKLGYYGSTYFVQKESVEEVVDNALTVSISESMIGTGNTGTVSLVLGIDGSDSDANCILHIDRVGDPEHTLADEPWTEYNTTHTPAPFTLKLEAGKELTYVDIKGTTADNQVVYNEADGYYHFGAADGPVVYMHLGKKAPYVSLQTVIQGDGPMGGAPIREYFFDNNGNFIKKEDYTEILTKYFENMDQDLGVYPLTEDLVYIIQNGCNGWWDAESPDYIFEGCNPEIGWMFALCYVA